jgi:hypothetical protein
LTIKSGGKADVVVGLKAGELKRVRTGWIRRNAKVEFEVEGGDGLRFDNLGIARM